MLKLFEVSGFKNFESTIRMNFADVHEYQFNPCCVSNGLLSKVIIYGKNSSGKSNFGLAMFDIVSHMTNNNVSPGLYRYYLNVTKPCNVASFHYVFAFDSGEVDYYYQKDEKQNLLYERVAIDGKQLFEYDHSTSSGELDGLRRLAPTLNLNFLDADSLLRYVIANTSLGESHPLYQMQRFVSNMLWFRCLDENRYIGYRSSSKDYHDFIFEESCLKEFEELLHRAGIEEKLTVKEDVDGNKRLYFDTPKPLPFSNVASSGTKALYTFFYWSKTASDVSLMFIDEFDAFYHYELAETVVALLEKMPNCQVVLTSHNTNLLSNRIMRPDCYFILNGGNLVAFVNATDRELREGHNLEKLFKSGEFDG